MIILAILGISSCSEIFEDDISGKYVSIISPSDAYSSPSNQIVFWWNELDGADWYHFQIVKPSFSSIESLIIDTNIVGTSFSCILPFGDYQWRIRPENSAYVGDYICRSLSIESDSDLTYQVIPLQLPSINDTTNINQQSFSWQTIQYADGYAFTIWKDVYNGVIEYSTTTATNSASYTFSIDGYFVWGVKAFNEESETVYYTRSILIDTQEPSTPALSLPVHGDTLSAGIINFSWVHSNGGSAVYDSLLISSSSSFSTISFESFGSASNSNFTLPIGTYYWKVKSIDAAGNSSPYSSVRSIVVE